MIRRNCEMCGDEFLVKRNSNPKRFCSKSCANSRKCPTRKNGKNIKCDTCGNTFYRQMSLINRNGENYCSWECRKTKLIKKECKECGKVFYHKSYWDRVYCSNECNGTISKYPKTSRYRRIIKQRNRRKNLSDIYIKRIIYQSSGLTPKEVPKELVELKRLNIKRKRIIKKRKTHGNSQ